MPNLCPILQANHPPNRVWVAYFSKSATGLVFEERWHKMSVTQEKWLDTNDLGIPIDAISKHSISPGERRHLGRRNQNGWHLNP
jgi:hypothetical protein